MSAPDLSTFRAHIGQLRRFGYGLLAFRRQLAQVVGGSWQVQCLDFNPRRFTPTDLQLVRAADS